MNFSPETILFGDKHSMLLINSNHKYMLKVWKGNTSEIGSDVLHSFEKAYIHLQPYNPGIDIFPYKLLWYNKQNGNIDLYLDHVNLGF